MLRGSHFSLSLQAFVLGNLTVDRAVDKEHLAFELGTMPFPCTDQLLRTGLRVASRPFLTLF